MKFKLIMLAAAVCLIDASDPCPAGLPSVNSLQAGPAVVQNDEVVEGVAAIVDDDVVTISEVQQQFAGTEKMLREYYQGEKLDALIKGGKLHILDSLIDRLVIIHEFRSEGGFIPDKYTEERIHDAILDEYAGDAKQFENTLTNRGVTLAEYKNEIVDNAIVGYMTYKFVAEKVKAMKPAGPDEEKRLTELTRKTWLDSLRQQSYVKNFWAPVAAH